MASPPPHVSYHCFRHFEQKLWRQDRCLGSVNKSEHAEQDTSSRRLWNSVVRSMMALGTKGKWPSMHSTPSNEVLRHSIYSFSRKQRTTSQSQTAIVRVNYCETETRRKMINNKERLSPLRRKNAWKPQLFMKYVKPSTVKQNNCWPVYSRSRFSSQFCLRGEGDLTQSKQPYVKVLYIIMLVTLGPILTP